MKHLIALCFALVLTQETAFGLGGKLSSPNIAFPANLDADRKEKLFKALEFMREDLKFIEGSFINEFSNQRFGGTSGQVAEFVGLLNDVGHWEVHVQFRTFGEQESAFTLDQNYRTKYLRLIVNSDREDFKLSDFKQFLPTPKLPDFPE